MESKHWNLNKIPKTIYFYWGNVTLPYMRYLSIKSFSVLNPDWNLVLCIPREKSELKITWDSNEHKHDYSSAIDYTNQLAEIPNLRLKYVEYPKHIEHYSTVHKSDLLRWNILTEFGGIWSDMDILYTKPMSELYINRYPDLAEQVDTVICFSSTLPYFFGHSIGFMMGSKGNKVFRQLYDLCFKEEIIDLKDYQCFGQKLLNRFNPLLFNPERRDAFILNLPTDIVYAYNFLTIKDIYDPTKKEDTLKQDTIGIHWYAGDSVSSKMCSVLTDKNLDEYDCIFTRQIKNILLK